MSFLQREHDKLMAVCQSLPPGSAGYDAVYAAKQALSWALDPDICASPSAQIGRHYGLSLEPTEGTGNRLDANPSDVPSTKAT